MCHTKNFNFCFIGSKIVFKANFHDLKSSKCILSVALRFQTSFKFVVCSISSHFHMYPKFVMHWDSKQTLQPRFLFLLSLKVYVCEPPYVSEAETSSEAARSPQLLFLSNRMRAQLVEDHAATHPRKFLVSNWTNFYI